MYRIYETGIETIAAAVVLIPVLLLLNRTRFHDRDRTIVYCFFALYLAAMYDVAGLPHVLHFRFDPNYNFKPFAYMFSDFENSFLNVILFFPLGFALPLLWAKYKAPWRTVLFGFLVSASIETLQLFSFRATDINDLMTNTLGTLLGYLAGRITWKLVPSVVPEKNTRELYLLFGLVFCVMFFVQPFLSPLIWTILL